jgi:hypothetical protein
MLLSRQLPTRRRFTLRLTLCTNAPPNGPQRASFKDWGHLVPFAISRLLRLLKMSSKRPSRYATARLTWLLLCTGIAGCQMSDVGLSNNSKNDDVKMPSTAVEESYGSDSGAEITLLLRKGQAGLYEGAARDLRDGAVLGIGELGANQVSLRVKDIGPGLAGIPAQVAAAKGRNAVLIVSYLPAAETAVIAAIPAAQRPPLLNLAGAAPAAGGDVFNLASDEIDSAADGVKAAIGRGHRKIAVLADPAFSQSDASRLSAAVSSAGGAVVGVGRYGTGDAAADILAKNRPLLQSADAVVILGATSEVGMVATAVRSAAVPNQIVIGTNSWPPSSYATPAVAGALVATVDSDSSSLIADRYQRHFNHALTIYGAYGYDAMAIVSGLVRAQGPQSVTAANLMSKVGFRGTTGLFRFDQTGMAERRLGLYTIDGGKLKAVTPPSQSF